MALANWSLYTGLLPREGGLGDVLRFSRAMWTWLSRPAYRGAEISVIYKEHPWDNFF